MKKRSIKILKYRKNRIGGAFGNINGQNVKDIPACICSGNVMNGIPKSKFGQITIPYYNDANSLLITKLIPYYVLVNNDNLKVSCPPKNAPPNKGWIVSSKRMCSKIALFNPNNTI